MTKRTRRSMGGETPGNKMSLGFSTAVRPGRSPGLEASVGETLDKRQGSSPGLSSSKGASLAVRRMNKGGFLGGEGPQDKLNAALYRQRANELGLSHGGHARKKVEKGLHAMYKILHSHFSGGSENDTESESQPEMKKKSGGKLWIQNAVKNKGALHRSLHVPEGKKIPISKIHKAEHSKSPTLRKRAQLAETLRGFHHKPQGR